jgi:hypothetical protein
LGGKKKKENQCKSYTASKTTLAWIFQTSDGFSFLQSRSFHLTRPVCVEWLDNASNVVRVPQYQGVFDWQDLLDKSSADIQHLKVFTEFMFCSCHCLGDW